jgi:small subunit ribosomal protein S6
MARPLPKHRAREYETIFIMHPESTATAIDKVAARVTEVVDRLDGKLLKAENWGRRRLAYPVRKNKKGVYVYVRYLGYQDIVHELERNLRLLDTVIKYLTVKVDEDVDPTARPVRDEDISFLPHEEEEPAPPPVAKAEPAEPTPEPEVEAAPVAPKPEAKADPPKPDPAPAAKAEPAKPTPEPEVEAAPAAPKPEAKAAPVAPKPAAKPAAPKPAAKPAAPKPEVKADPVSPKPTAKPDPVSPKPTAKPDPVSPKPEVKADPVSPKPTAKADEPEKQE